MDRVLLISQRGCRRRHALPRLSQQIYRPCALLCALTLRCGSRRCRNLLLRVNRLVCVRAPDDAAGLTAFVCSRLKNTEADVCTPGPFCVYKAVYHTDRIAAQALEDSHYLGERMASLLVVRHSALRHFWHLSRYHFAHAVFLHDCEMHLC